MKYYTSDLHLGHSKLVEFHRTSFSTIEEHDNFIINQWNSTVNNGDLVYVVGDFVWKSSKLAEYINRLNGGIILIKGNHDRLDNKHNTYFEAVYSLKQIKDGKHKIILCHYPLEEWNQIRQGAIHIHGHIHGKDNQDKLAKIPNRYNINCELHNYKPLTIEEILK